MTAIVTDKLRKQLAVNLFDEASNTTDSNHYYVGIGKSDTYDSSDTTVDPLRTEFEEREARANLESIKAVTSNSFVIPRYNWTSGTTYSGYNDKQVGYPTNAYYVMTDENEVYICLQQGKAATGTANASTVKPSYSDEGVSETQAFETSDGYRWKLLYTVSAGRASSFLTAGFIPVKLETTDSGSAQAFELQQLNIQNTATPGQIVGVEVVDGGSGYTSAPTLTFRGNGSNAAATATISGGQIVKVEMSNESAGMGSGYDFASISQSGGGSTNATLRPIIGPRDGFGKDVRQDLKSTSVMFNVKPDGTESGTFNTTNDFRQISLLRNIKYRDSDGGTGTNFNGSVSRANRKLTITSTISSSGFVVDEKFTGGTSGASAFIDELDSSNGDTIFFHQNSKTANGIFTDGETITGDQGGTAVIDSGDLYSQLDEFSGELLYIENRARIVRSTTQTEDIKVIITV